MSNIEVPRSTIELAAKAAAAFEDLADKLRIEGQCRPSRGVDYGYCQYACEEVNRVAFDAVNVLCSYLDVPEAEAALKDGIGWAAAKQAQRDAA